MTTIEAVIIVLTIAVFLIVICYITSPGTLGSLRKEAISLTTEALVNNIKDNPTQWRSSNNYFYNNSLGYVFWVSCNRGQFSCVGDRHIKTRGFGKFPCSQGQLNHLYAAYTEWINVYNALNIIKPLPDMPITKGIF